MRNANVVMSVAADLGAEAAKAGRKKENHWERKQNKKQKKVSSSKTTVHQKMGRREKQCLHV